MRVQPGYRPRPVIKKRVVNEMTHFSLGNYLADGIGNIPTYVMLLIIVGILGAESTAYFRIAFAIAALLFTLPYAICTSLFVEGSHEPERFRSNLITASKLIFPFLIGAITLIFLFGDKLLLLFGGEYSRNSLHLLWLLSLSSIPLAVNEIYVVLKRVQLAIRPMLYLYLAITALTLGLSYPLIAEIGLTGVGIGWVAGQGVVALVVGGMMVRQFRRSA